MRIRPVALAFKLMASHVVATLLMEVLETLLVIAVTAAQHTSCAVLATLPPATLAHVMSLKAVPPWSDVV